MKNLINSSANKESLVHDRNLSFLQNCINEKKYLEAIDFASININSYPNVIGYKKTLAFCFSMIGELSKSKQLWLDLINIDPYSEETLLNLAEIEKKLNRLDSALGLIKLATEYCPTSYKPWMSMAEVCLLKKEYESSLNSSLEALKINPSSADAYQNLGSSFFHLAKFDEAKHAFETSLLLNPATKEAKHSLGLVLFKQDKIQEALKIMMELISSSQPSDRLNLDQIKWDASLMLLRLGDLDKGWEFYEFGLSPKVFGNLSRRPLRTFDVEEWTPLCDKNLPFLIWREQGVGDEILFATCLHDLINAGFKPIVECDKRLIQIFQRSFPSVSFREPSFSTDSPYYSLKKDFLYHIPMGSLMKHYRSKLEYFPNSGGYLKSDDVLENKWRGRIRNSLIKKKRIGISWRSGILDPLRNSKYSSLADWGPLLSSKNFDFFNLQFGDCIDEIKDAENRFSININRCQDLDLRNDIDDIFSLISNLDHVVTISSAVWTFSAALGIPTTLLLHAPHWTMFDQNYVPFFPNVKCRMVDNNNSFSDLLLSVVEDITRH
jgi:tetratricopeptide (TPR) repeat protein